MIKRIISIILLLTSTTAFAADQSATIPNSRILNEDPASARQKVDAASLGKLEEDAGLKNDTLRATILADLVAYQKETPQNYLYAPLAVKENFQTILGKAIEWKGNPFFRNPKQVELWEEVIAFLQEANHPARWTDKNSPEVKRISKLSTPDLYDEFEKSYKLNNVDSGPYSLTRVDWKLFQMDFVNFFVGFIMMRDFLKGIEQTAARKGVDPNSFPNYLEVKQNLENRAKTRLVLREWVYRHWDGSHRPRTIRSPKGTVLPVLASSLGRASDPKVMPVIVEEYYQSIYGKVVEYIAATPQRVEVRNAWMFTKRFLEEAENPALWLAKETPTEAADTKRFAHMTTRELEAEFDRYYRFSYYSLRILKWEHLRADTVGNFMNGILLSRKILKEDGFTPQEREPYLHNAIAGQIFREWVYRHWNAARRPASYMFFPSGASLGKIAPSPVAESYESIRAKVAEAAVSDNKKLTELEDSYLKGLGLVMDGKLSTKELQQRKSAIVSQRFYNKKYAYAKDFFDKALNPSSWMKEETPSERKETDDFSKMSNEELKNKFSEQYTFANYSLEGITAEIFLGDTLPNFLYGALWLLEESQQATGTYVSKTPAQRIFREWVYRHWNHEPKDPSHTFFTENFQPAQQASSLGKQVLVFQMNSGLNKEILDKTAELMRSNPDKSVIFVVGRREEGKAVRKALKARGLSVKDVPFEVNALRSQDDREQFSKYVHGLQAKFPDKNAVAVIADFRILAGLNSKEIISIARDKAGQGSNQLPVSIAEIKSTERKGTDAILFGLAWKILSASTPANFRDQIEEDASTGVFLIRLNVLQNLLQQWLAERENSRQLQAAA